ERVKYLAQEYSVWSAVPVTKGRDEGILLQTDHMGSVIQAKLVREPSHRSVGLDYKCAGIQFLTADLAVELGNRLDQAIRNEQTDLYADLILATLLPSYRVVLCNLDQIRWAEIDCAEDIKNAEKLFAHYT